MKCNCGGSSFKESSVSRASKVIAEYSTCRACERVEWAYGRKEAQAEGRQKGSIGTQALYPNYLQKEE